MLGQPLQAKLLRVLQEREFEPLGSERPQKVDVRVIAATNRDLQQMVAEGKFQEDLFYRLNVIPIRIPPLRERREDIAVLAEHFVRKHAHRSGRPAQRLHESALAVLQRYDWPGNARELENTIERAVVPLARAAHRRRRDFGAPCRRALGSRAALDAAPPEHRVDGARNDPARARFVRRNQEGRGGTDGHQPARAEPLPRQAPPVGPTALIVYESRNRLRPP